MASSKEYLNFILAQLFDLEDVSCRAMMGEYILYYKGKIVGGIYDDRLLVKPVKSAVHYMPDAEYALPYDDQKYLTGLFKAMFDELPAPKSKKKI